MSKKREYHFLEPYNKIPLKISYRLEGVNVKCVVCKFCINYGKEENVRDNSKQK